MRRTVKDSVFTYLFGQPEYTRQLYLALHPEDTDVTENDCKIVTLENVLATDMYNDVGFQVRDKLLILVEAQSTFSENLALRLFLYLAETYKQYVIEHKLNLFASKPIAIPRPELYVVYTGPQKNLPDVLCLSNLYNGNGSVENIVKVIRGTEGKDILSQYVKFCKISDEQRKIHGLTQNAVEETLKKCLENDVLVPFLSSRRKEVTEIMVTLFNEEEIQRIHDHSVRQEGREEGRQQGRQEMAQAMKEALKQKGFLLDDSLLRDVMEKLN